MRALGISILVLGLCSAQMANGAPHYYTAEQLATMWQGKVHPGEAARGENFLKSVRRGGFWIGCAAAVGAFAYGRLGKVFHQGVIGATFARFELDPNRPPEIRYGSFSDEIPTVSWGIASFTTGRDTPKPNQLIPDVTGLSVVLMQNGVWAPWSATASRGAFARSGERFARLAGYPALARMLLGFMSPEGLRNAHQELRDDPNHGELPYQGENPYREAPGLLRRGAIAAGGFLGEGLFAAGDPVPGLGTLTPAILSGRRTPFPGFRDVGFGTDTRLLTDSVGLSERRAFRVSFSLADNETNRQLFQETPGWLVTVNNNLRGRPVTDDGRVRLYRGQHLSAEFDKWMSKPGVEISYDVYIQLDDPTRPKLTPIEDAHKGWYSEKIRVGTLTLVSYGDQHYVAQSLSELASGMHVPPGNGYHIPVGDLAWYRAVARLVGSGSVTVDDTRDGTKGETAIGAYPQSRDLRAASSPEADMEKLRQLYRAAGYAIP